MQEKKKTIAAIMGTFNPVTLAHLAMGDIAMSALDIPPENVIYVPAKDSFLKGWKALGAASVLSEQDRIRMLRAAAQTKGFSVSSCEIDGLVSGYTTDTLDYLRREYGAETVYMVMGTDKPGELHRWHAFPYLMENFHFLVISRNHQNVFDVIDAPGSPLAPWRDHFTQAEGSDALQDVSSTLVREALSADPPDWAAASQLMPAASLSILKSLYNQGGNTK